MDKDLKQLLLMVIGGYIVYKMTRPKLEPVSINKTPSLYSMYGGISGAPSSTPNDPSVSQVLSDLNYDAYKARSTTRLYEFPTFVK